MDSLEVNKVLDLLRLVSNLKRHVRKGWECRGIDKAESIASHMLRCVQLALVHDLAKCVIRDLTPQDDVPKDMEYQLQDKAMQDLTRLLGNEVGKLIYDLYKEYEKKETEEAKFVRDLDQFDMILTAARYEERDSTPGHLQDFFDSTHGKFRHPFIKKLADALESQRKTNFYIIYEK